MFRIRLILVFAALYFLIYSCSSPPHIRPVDVNWYFWKTKISTQDHLNFARYNKHAPLYIRVMDVAWNEGKQKVVPVAPLQADSFPSKWVPVIYITNQVFYHVDSLGVDSLSNQLLGYLQQLIPYDGWTRIQLDCDWTETTRDRYFYLLDCIRVKLGKELSSTIRLHQISAYKKMGIPPVNHAVLMCYNMQSPARVQTTNSIYQLSLLKDHTKKISTYPVQLDIAFPLYTWAVVFRGGKFHTLINQVTEDEVQGNNFKKGEGNWYSATESCRLRGFSILENDRIRLEITSEKELDAGIQYLLNQLPNPTKLIWYHMDGEVITSRKSLVGLYTTTSE